MARKRFISKMIERETDVRRRAEQALGAMPEALATEANGSVRLQELGSQLVPARDSTSLLLRILEAAIRRTSADMGNIQMLDSNSGTLQILASCGFKRPFLDFFDSVHDGQAACGTAMQRGKRVVIEDVTSSPTFAGLPALEVMLSARVHAVQSTPLVSRSGRLVGMLSTHYRTPRRPTDRDLHILDRLARQAADCLKWIQAEMTLRRIEGKLTGIQNRLDSIESRVARVGMLERPPSRLAHGSD